MLNKTISEPSLEAFITTFDAHLNDGAEVISGLIVVGSPERYVATVSIPDEHDKWLADHMASLDSFVDAGDVWRFCCKPVVIFTAIVSIVILVAIVRFT